VNRIERPDGRRSRFPYPPHLEYVHTELVVVYVDALLSNASITSFIKAGFEQI